MSAPLPRAVPMTETVAAVNIAICMNCRDRIVNHGGSGWYHFGEDGRHGEQRCPTPSLPGEQPGGQR